MCSIPLIKITGGLGTTITNTARRRATVNFLPSINNIVGTKIEKYSCNCYCNRFCRSNRHHQSAAGFFKFSSMSTNEEVAVSDDATKRKPFKILGVQQIAIGSSERDSLNTLWKDVFGLIPHDTVSIEKENVIEDIVQLGPSPYTVEIDLMTPYDITKSPKVHIPPLNHIGLWVDNLQEAVTYMTNIAKVRFTPGGIRRGAAGYDVIFIHPKGNDEYPVCGNGVLIELAQAPQNVIDAYTKKQIKI
jgi:lactoylglutathione lyase